MLGQESPKALFHAPLEVHAQCLLTSLNYFQWNFAPNQGYAVCDITIATEPKNWLRTDFIDVKDAKILNVKLKYNLMSCPPIASSFCKHKWSIYVLHVDR